MSSPTVLPTEAATAESVPTGTGNTLISSLGATNFYIMWAGVFIFGAIFVVSILHYRYLQRVLRATLRRAFEKPLLRLEQIEMIGDFEYAANETDTECSICISAFIMGDICRTLPHPCGHTFHKACIDEWFGRSSHCPLCNRSMYDHFQQQAAILEFEQSAAGVSGDSRENRSLFHPVPPELVENVLRRPQDGTT